ncbi:MAG TPA: HK97 gp10 family phage protein [Stellaceae bacterium]|nr:HK97 gp10 family phage protein [Stellaceae bacterium]HUN48021.1 HK97 gp10 family phage protein [Stellaceae bacterium]
MIAGSILGGDALADRLAALPDAARQGLARALTRVSLDLVAAAQRNLSGAVLQSRSGALRASITADVAEEGGTVAMTVGSDLPYAAFQEYGFAGVETVSAHLRTIREAFGRPLRGGEQRIAVRAYSRKVDYPAHSFLRSALAELQPELMDAVAAALDEAVAP